MRSFFSSWFFRVVVCWAVLLSVSAIVVAKDTFTIKASASWVRKVVPGTDPTSVSPEAGTRSTRILDDEQTKVGSSVERYYHYYQSVDNTAGLEDLSQLRFYFEPSYQQLAIHFVRVLRGGSVIDALKPSEIKMIQEEADLDQQLYNGTSAAVIFVNDVRVGDVVEYAYTITGENPVLSGRFTDIVYLADNEPIKEKFFRVLYPSKRLLAIKSDNTELQPSKQVIGDDTEYLWYAKDVSGVPSDDSTPNWFNPYPRINLSEFQSWAEVVDWALPFYQNSALNNSELHAKVEEWKKTSEVPEQRTVAALRFVQDGPTYRYGVYIDGNANGVRAADIATGIDRLVSHEERLVDQFGGIDLGVLPALPGLDPSSAPPGTDAVKLGSGNMATFTPEGSATPGSLYILGPRSVQLMIRIVGETGRTRIFKFDTRSRVWKPL